MMTNEPTTLESAILDRVVAPKSGGGAAETARCALELQMPPKDCSRMGELSEKASEGTLTPDERREAEAYDRVGLFLELLQSKARLSLKGA
jgi:hypothetical protein